MYLFFFFIYNLTRKSQIFLFLYTILCAARENCTAQKRYRVIIE